MRTRKSLLLVALLALPLTAISGTVATPNAGAKGLKTCVTVGQTLLTQGKTSKLVSGPGRTYQLILKGIPANTPFTAVAACPTNRYYQVTLGSFSGWISGGHVTL